MTLAGFFIQWWYHKSLRARMKDAKFLLGLVIVTTTWIVQYLIYIDAFPLPTMLSALLPWIPEQAGRTWLWNSWQPWQFGGSHVLLDMPGGMVQIAAVLALSYPLWYFFGIWIGRCVFGNKSHEHGVLWLFQPEKGTAPAPGLDPADSGDDSASITRVPPRA